MINLIAKWNDDDGIQNGIPLIPPPPPQHPFAILTNILLKFYNRIWIIYCAALVRVLNMCNWV